VFTGLKKCDGDILGVRVNTNFLKVCLGRSSVLVHVPSRNRGARSKIEFRGRRKIAAPHRAEFFKRFRLEIRSQFDIEQSALYILSRNVELSLNTCMSTANSW